MRRFAVFLLSALPAFAAGTVNQVSQQLGTSTTWALTLNWTGDATTGTVPSTLAKLPPEIGYGQGYRIVSAETAPGTVQPTANYNVMLTDSVGLDLLGGAAIGLSATAAQTFAGNSSAPIYGAFSLLITGNSVGGAKGNVIVYISPISAIVLSPGLIPPPVTPGLIPDTIIAGGSLAAQCAHAQGLNVKYSVAITKNWTNVPTQHIPCTLVQAGGSITAGTGQVVTYDGAPILTRQPLFDCGTQYGSIVMGQGYATPELTGAIGYSNSPGPSSAADASPGFMCAAHSIPATGGTLDLAAGLTYYLKTAQTTQFPAFDFPITHGTTFNGNGAVLDYSAIPSNAQVFETSPAAQPAFQVLCPSAPTCIPMSDAAQGSFTVTVSDGTKFAPTHEIYIQGGGNGTGDEVNSELNVVMAISGNVLTLQTPLGKSYTGTMMWPSMAWDVDALTTKNFTTENLTIQGDGVFPLLDIQSDGDVIRNVSSLGPGQNAILTGYNRHWTFDNYYAEIQSGGVCPGGGLLQISQSSSFVEIKNSTFNSHADINCGVNLNEGSFGFSVHNNTFYNVSVAIGEFTGGGVIDIYNNKAFFNGSTAGTLGMITNNCCSGTPFPMNVRDNYLEENNTSGFAIQASAASSITGNTVHTLSTSEPALYITSLTGGIVDHNIITAAGNGILIGGVPDFPISNNNITGQNASGTYCIAYTESTSQAGGPLAIGNSCRNSDRGIGVGSSNLSFFANRALTGNTFENVTTPYVPAGLPAIQIVGSNGSQVSVLGAPYDSAYDPGMVIPGYLKVKLGASGVTPVLPLVSATECPNNCQVGILGPDGSHLTLIFEQPGSEGFINYQLDGSSNPFVQLTLQKPVGTTVGNLFITPAGIQPTATTSGYLSQDGTAGHTGSTCSAWKNGLCVAP